MSRLPPSHADAVRTIHEEMTAIDHPWALTGSASFALQGVPVDPNDVDVQTSAAGAYALEKRLADRIVEPVSFVESPRIRSHLGEFRVDGVPVEVMGDLQKLIGDAWEPPVDVVDHREWVAMGDLAVPVLSLEYEVTAYERYGRPERAALLRDHLE